MNRLNNVLSARGLLFVFHSRAGLDHYAATDELMRKEFGVPSLLRNIDPKLKVWSVGMQEVATDGLPPGAFALTLDCGCRGDPSAPTVVSARRLLRPVLGADA